MYVQVIDFHLADMTEEGYRETCEGFTAAYARLPGLLAKVWLADPATNTHGGVHLLRDRAAVEAYVASDLFATVPTFPHFADITARDFAVYEDFTRVIRPGLAVLIESVA